MARSKAADTTTSPRRSLDEAYLNKQPFEYMLPPQNSQNEDKGMFSYQHTRQLSTSPPPVISYQPYSPADSAICGPDMGRNGYFSLPITSSDSNYLLPTSHGFAGCLSNVPAAQMKQEYYEEDDINPFSLSYASMAGVDIPATYSYQTPMTLVRSASSTRCGHAADTV